MSVLSCLARELALDQLGLISVSTRVSSSATSGAILGRTFESTRNPAQLGVHAIEIDWIGRSETQFADIGVDERQISFATGSARVCESNNKSGSNNVNPCCISRGQINRVSCNPFSSLQETQTQHPNHKFTSTVSRLRELVTVRPDNGSLVDETLILEETPLLPKHAHLRPRRL